MFFNGLWNLDTCSLIQLILLHEYQCIFFIQEAAKKLAVNGKPQEGSLNGHCNGTSTNGVCANGVSNGKVKGQASASSASDYYIQHDNMRLTHRP